MDLFRCSQSSDEFLSLLSPVSLLLTLVGGQTLLATSFSTYFFVDKISVIFVCVLFNFSFSEVFIVKHSVTKMQKHLQGLLFTPASTHRYLHIASYTLFI